MKYDSKNHAIILPVLNHHKKSPSMPDLKPKGNQLTERPSSRSHVISQNLLPKIFKSTLLNNIKAKKIINSNFDVVNSIKEDQDILTPSFNNEIRDKNEKFIRNNNFLSALDKSLNRLPKEPLTSARYSVNQTDISFGELDLKNNNCIL